MTEEQLLDRWTQERPMYEAWGAHVVGAITNRLEPLIAPVSAAVFLRIPPKARSKADGSLIEKAFYRKKYDNPYDDITDKVGVRFVVLLNSQLPVLRSVIEGIADWTYSLDRDFEAEQEKSPQYFDYAAYHYVVRAAGDIICEGVEVKAGTPCEVQVKTILQHAYSELTHDTIYKPQIDATSSMRRMAAKSMALMEATSDYFEQVVSEVARIVATQSDVTAKLSALYRERVGREPEPTRTEGLLQEAYEESIGGASEAVNSLLQAKPYVADRIKARATSRLLFRQPSILLVYALVAEQPRKTASNWPLTLEELQPIFVDLGQAWDG